MPVAATDSVFVAVQPEVVHLYVLTPAATQVGCVVMLPLFHVCLPVAATDSVFVAVQPELVHL